MQNERQKRVISGRNKILNTVALFADDPNITVDALMTATVEVLLAAVMDDTALAAARLRHEADGLESGRYCPSSGFLEPRAA